jgi:hypothetical protein
MERVKSFQEMLKEGTFAATDAMLATGVAMVVIGILAILAPLASGVLFDNPGPLGPHGCLPPGPASRREPNQLRPP